MNHLHQEFDLSANAVVEVTLDRQANVLLLDSLNYQAYRRGGSYRYTGGLAKVSPARLRPPHAGHWHIVIDLGGYAGQVRAGVRVLQ
ncbi:MAG TPA: DUF1883 domain-containing protein [Herpetosiphonaceae bacterium]|nr:DUF1883 domain-containing protein [Herpetosiphonaceae bacterium]